MFFAVYIWHTEDLAKKQLPESRFVKKYDAHVHEKMGDEGAYQNTIGLKQKAWMVTIPGDSGCIRSHKYNEGEVFYNTCNVTFKAFPGDVKVEKTANH